MRLFKVFRNISMILTFLGTIYENVSLKLLLLGRIRIECCWHASFEDIFFCLARGHIHILLIFRWWLLRCTNGLQVHILLFEIHRLICVISKMINFWFGSGCSACRPIIHSAVVSDGRSRESSLSLLFRLICSSISNVHHTGYLISNLIFLSQLFKFELFVYCWWSQMRNWIEVSLVERLPLINYGFAILYVI